MIRIGQSTDIHRLEKGKTLILGGIKIEAPYGAIAHSDGDCLVHAIAEAMIGALGRGDLGSHFSDRDPQYENISSLVLLKTVCDMIKEHGYHIVNIDSLIILEAPKLRPYIDAMKKRLSDVMEIDSKKINIKATTAEGIGPIGQKQAIECQAVVLLKED